MHEAWINTGDAHRSVAIGMAFAVLIAASLVRMILMPAVMALLDRHAWWIPRWLDRILPHLQLEGSADEPEPTPDTSAA